MNSFTQFRCVLSTVSVRACACVHILKLNVDMGCFPWLLSTFGFEGSLTDSANLAEQQAPGILLPLPPGTGIPGTHCNFSLWGWPRSSHLNSKHCSAWPISRPQRKYCIHVPKAFFPDSAGHPEPGLWKCWANALLLSYTQPKGVFHLLIILFGMGHTEYDFTVWHKSTVC